MKIIDCVQGTPEWLAAKCGVPSSSDFDKIITIDGKVSKQRERYLYQLAGERITKQKEESYQNANMLRGLELEDEARKYYSVITGRQVKTVGFCITEGKAVYGASPDGLVGNNGSVQIKCPLMSTHISYVLAKKLPADYYQQTQGELLVLGRAWLDFISYYPMLKPLLVRVTPDRSFQSKLKKELESFCADLNKIVRQVKR